MRAFGVDYTNSILTGVYMTDQTIDNPFFHTGGALPLNSASYIERDADNQLFRSLSNDEFCYVLVSRQMGKSSLMVKTISQLRDNGVAALLLDINAVGHELTRKQWYYTMIIQLARNLNCRDKVRLCWESLEDQGPLQQWVGTLQYILKHIHPGKMVIFIDEIDQIRLMPFSCDEFFAGIRSCHSRREEDPEFQRVTFCMLGVALPSELISDHRITPFNIATRIELSDFDERQSQVFKAGLQRDEFVAQQLLKRVHYWTNGHPYLTQRLCRAIVDDPNIRSNKQLDVLCERLFLSAAARQQDDNLTFVSNRLLRSDEDITQLLDIYRKVRGGQRVEMNKGNPIMAVLVLSGIVRIDGFVMKVRNRIYERVFDLDWIKSSMPDAERKRQKAAYLRGVIVTASVALTLTAIISGLAIFGFAQSNRASRLADALRLNLYASNLRVATEDIKDAQFEGAVDRLNTAVPMQKEEDLRGFDWRLVRQWSIGNADTVADMKSRALDAALRPSTGVAVALTNNGRTLCVFGPGMSAPTPISSLESDPGLKAVWCGDTNRVAVATASGKVVIFKSDSTASHSAMSSDFVNTSLHSITTLTSSPDGGFLAVGDSYGGIKVLSANNGRYTDFAVINDVEDGADNQVTSLAFSPNSRMLAAGSRNLTVKIWDLSTKNLKSQAKEKDWINAVAFSPDGRYLASGSDDAGIVLWSADTENHSTKLHEITRDTSGDAVQQIQFNANGSDFAVAQQGGVIGLWRISQNTKTQQHTLTDRGKLLGALKPATSVYFRDNGRRCYSVHLDGTVRGWWTPPNTSWSGAVSLMPLPKDGGVYTMAASPDGLYVAAGCFDGKIRVWDRHTWKLTRTIAAHSGKIVSVRFAPVGCVFASASEDKTIKVWDLAGGENPLHPEPLHTLQNNAAAYAVTFSPDGKYLAGGGENDIVNIWRTSAYDQRPEKIVISRDPAKPDYVNDILFSPKANYLAIASGKGSVYVYITEKWTPKTILEGHTKEATLLAFAPDGQTLASSSLDHTVRLWDMTNLRPIDKLQFNLAVLSLAFSPDGRTIATGGRDRTVRLWNLATRRETVRVAKFTNAVSAVAFCPDDMALVAGTGDYTAPQSPSQFAAWVTIPKTALGTSNH